MNMDQISYKCLHTDNNGFYDCMRYADGRELPQGIARHPYCHRHNMLTNGQDWAFCAYLEEGVPHCFQWVPRTEQYCPAHGGASFKEGDHRKHYALFGIPHGQDAGGFPNRCLLSNEEGQLICLRPAFGLGITHPFCKEHATIPALRMLWGLCAHAGCGKWARRIQGEKRSHCAEHGGADFFGGNHLGYLQKHPSVAYFRGLPVAQCHHKSDLGLQCGMQARILYWEQLNAENRGTGTYFWGTWPYCVEHSGNSPNKASWVICSRCEHLKRGHYVWLQPKYADGPYNCEAHQGALAHQGTPNICPYLFGGGPGRDELFASLPLKRARSSYQVTPEKPIPPTLEVDSGVKTLAQRMQESLKLLSTANFKVVGLGEDAKQTEEAMQIFFGTYEELIGVALSVVNRAAKPAPPPPILDPEEIEDKITQKRKTEETQVQEKVDFPLSWDKRKFLGLNVRTSLFFPGRREISLNIGPKGTGNASDSDLEHLVNLFHAAHGQVIVPADKSSREDQAKLTFRFPSVTEAEAVFEFLKRVL